MKNNSLQYTLWILVAMTIWMMSLFTYIVFNEYNQNPLPVNTVTCPSDQATTTESVSYQGSDCRVIHADDSDLLQPSGLWMEQTLQCWKLETPIKEFCAKHPDYCGDNK